MKNKLIIASMLAATLGGGYALADRSEHGEHGERCGHGAKSGMMKHHGGFGGDHKMGHKEMFEREFSTDQIRTLAEAQLLMHGNENLKVGKITSNENGYVVAIVTQDDSLVEEREVAKNGMPLDRYEHIKARMEKRSLKDQ